MFDAIQKAELSSQSDPFVGYDLFCVISSFHLHPLFLHGHDDR